MANSNTELPPYVAFYGMSRDPFSPEVETDMFFAEPTRKQRLDVMLHLAEYGNEIMVVIGPRGSGKTAMLQQFISNKQENWVTATITALEGIDERKFLQQLYRQLDLAFRGASYNELLDYMQKHFRHMHENSQVPVILIDNAEQLPVTALKKVLEMASLTTDDNKPLIRIIMFGTENIKEHFKQPQLGHLANLPIRSLELPSFSEEQTAHYILHRSLAAKFSSKEIFNEATVLKVYRDSYGWPARINEICREILLKSIPSKQQDTLPGMESKSRNPKQMIAALLVIAILGGLFISQGNIDDWINKGRNLATSPTEKQESQRPNISPKQITPAQNKPVKTAQPQTLVDKLKNRNVDYQKTPANSEEVNSGKQASATGSDNATATVNKNQTDAVSGSVTTDINPLNIPHGNAWIMQQKASHYTLQVVAGHSLETISAFIKRHQLKENIALYQSVRKDKPWYGLIYGNYANKQLAETAVNQLPPKLKKLKPWIRDINGIQKDIRKVPIASPKQETSLVERLSKPAKPAPVKTQQAQQAGIEITRQEDWILKQRARHYTLQLMADSKLDTISRFVNRYQLKDSIALYRTTRQDKPWHVLIYGIYSSNSLANTAIEHLPSHLRLLQPSIRQYSDVHQDIKKVQAQ